MQEAPERKEGRAGEDHAAGEDNRVQEVVVQGIKAARDRIAADCPAGDNNEGDTLTESAFHER